MARSDDRCFAALYPADVLKRDLDEMEIVKMDVLHPHVSDNEGFRIDSAVFPKLQTDGCRHAARRNTADSVGARPCVVDGGKTKKATR